MNDTAPLKIFILCRRPVIPQIVKRAGNVWHRTKIQIVPTVLEKQEVKTTHQASQPDYGHYFEAHREVQHDASCGRVAQYLNGIYNANWIVLHFLKSVAAIVHLFTLSLGSILWAFLEDCILTCLFVLTVLGKKVAANTRSIAFLNEKSSFLFLLLNSHCASRSFLYWQYYSQLSI